MRNKSITALIATVMVMALYTTLTTRASDPEDIPTQTVDFNMLFVETTAIEAEIKYDEIDFFITFDEIAGVNVLNQVAPESEIKYTGAANVLLNGTDAAGKVTFTPAAAANSHSITVGTGVLHTTVGQHDSVGDIVGYNITGEAAANLTDNTWVEVTGEANGDQTWSIASMIFPIKEYSKAIVLSLKFTYEGMAN